MNLDDIKHEALEIFCREMASQVNFEESAGNRDFVARSVAESLLPKEDSAISQLFIDNPLIAEDFPDELGVDNPLFPHEGDLPWSDFMKGHAYLSSLLRFSLQNKGGNSIVLTSLPAVNGRHPATDVFEVCRKILVVHLNNHILRRWLETHRG